MLSVNVLLPVSNFRLKTSKIFLWISHYLLKIRKCKFNSEVLIIRTLSLGIRNAGAILSDEVLKTYFVEKDLLRLRNQKRKSESALLLMIRTLPLEIRDAVTSLSDEVLRTETVLLTIRNLIVLIIRYFFLNLYSLIGIFFIDTLF